VAYNADDETLAAYGLGENATLVTVTYGGADEEDDSDETAEAAETETFTLAIGLETEDGYYAALPDSRMVYLVDADTVETLLSSTAEE
jgi:hypothetical protein